MRSIALFVPVLAAIAAVGLGACGGKVFVDSTTGTGTGVGGATSSTAAVLPNTTTVGTTVTTSTFDATTTTVVQGTATGGDPCTTGSDCSQCADFNTCSTCVQSNHPEGAQVYNDLVNCIYCTACYTVCSGASAGCQNAPPTKDACDVGSGPNACYDQTMNPPGGCIPCAEAGSCKPNLDKCSQDMDCIAFNNDLQACPMN